MIIGGQRRAKALRVHVSRELLQSRLDKLAADLGLQLPAHAIDAQLVARIRQLSAAPAPVETGELR